MAWYNGKTYVFLPHPASRVEKKFSNVMLERLGELRKILKDL